MLDNIPAEVLQQLTVRQAWHYEVLPFRFDARGLWVYASQKQELQEELAFVLGKQVHVEVIDKAELQKGLAKHYRRQDAGREYNPAEESTNNGKGLTLDFRKNFSLDALIFDAKRQNASDIHLEPYESRCRVRFRIDGVLIERFMIPSSEYPALVNKIKIKANLDIAEKRLPQDGRIFVEEGGSKFDIRVSSLPTLHGEKIVMRLLSGSEARIDIHTLGFEAAELERYLEGASRPNGLVLISGPTGSGKTTTLYATLQLLNSKERNILTIEDPIEYTLEGINQVQLREIIGLDFSSALRTFLRQDPDIIMVGEIRDVNTANMAIRASLTGHLVLSTIHTNSAWGIIARLIDMGLPEYLLADTLNTAAAQRLIRCLCPFCKREISAETLKFPRQFRPPFSLSSVYEPVGCEQCYFTGYKGRRAIYEVISIDQELADAIKSVRLDIRKLLNEKNVTPLPVNAFQLLATGETSFQEIYSILMTAQ